MPQPKPAQVKDNWKLLPGRVLVGALVLDALLAIAFAVTVGIGKTSAIRPLWNMFGLNGEGNLPAWYSGMQLFLLALVCLVLASWIFASDERIAPLRRLFFTVGLVAIYLSADEVGQVHERMSRIAQSWKALNAFELSALAAFGLRRKEIHGGSLWIPLFAIIGIALLVWLWPQLTQAWKLWRTEFVLLGLGFATLVLGATVVETIGNVLQAFIKVAVEVGFEETLEMVGVTVMLYAAVRVLADAGSRLLPPSVTQPTSPTESQTATPTAE